MDVKIHESWKKELEDEFEKPYFTELTTFVRKEYLNTTVYPAPQNIFNAFDHCHYDDVRVVIIGQDPYHGPGQAHGLCFSVPDGITPPPSLKNIYKEILEDIGSPISESGNLERWADQGVLLLNATLTVRARQAGSHQKKGWEQFTDAVIQMLSDKKENLVFLLWGKYAQQKGAVVDQSKHLVLTAPHPSPFSAHSGFFGSKHFSQTNLYLEDNNFNPITW